MRICREFQRHNIGVTLFPVGYAILNNLERPIASYENLYPRLRDMGHEFGCHLHTHRDITGFSVQQLIDEELEPALHAMRRALGPGFRPVGIRPPYGIVNDALREVSERYGIPLVLWGLDSQDAICAKACADQCVPEDLTSYEVYSRIWGAHSKDGLCSKESCGDHCVRRIVSNYESYLRPGTIILHHTIHPSYLAIQPILRLLRNWNLQPIRLSELLTYAPA